MPELELPCGQTCTAVSVKMYRKYTEIMERNEDGAIEDAVDANMRILSQVFDMPMGRIREMDAEIDIEVIPGISSGVWKDRKSP